MAGALLKAGEADPRTGIAVAVGAAAGTGAPRAAAGATPVFFRTARGVFSAAEGVGTAGAAGAGGRGVPAGRAAAREAAVSRGLGMGKGIPRPTGAGGAAGRGEDNLLSRDFFEGCFPLATKRPANGATRHRGRGLLHRRLLLPLRLITTLVRTLESTCIGSRL